LKKLGYYKKIMQGDSMEKLNIPDFEKEIKTAK